MNNHTSVYKIFISHYSQEKEIASQIRSLIEWAYSGLPRVFISLDIPPGRDWLKEIKEALNGADEIITVFTHKSVERPWINIETGYGIMADIATVTPVVFGGFKKADLPVHYQIREAVSGYSRSDICGFFNTVLSRIRERIPGLQTQCNEIEFWEEWEKRTKLAVAQSPFSPLRANVNPVVWLLGSHRNLENNHLQQNALQVCRVLARAFIKHQIQIVMGTSRMLEYLGDTFVDYADNPEKLSDVEGDDWRKAIAVEHAQSDRPAPNPIVLLGSLRSKGSIREIFDDTIGRFPDIAILIGGRIEDKSGRATEEAYMAKDAGIPFLPLKFTGGAAATFDDTLSPSLEQKVRELQTLSSNVDRLRTLIVDIVREQAAIQSSIITPRDVSGYLPGR